MQYFSAFWIASALLGSVAAHASDWCDDPIKSICEQSKVYRMREDAYDKMVKELERKPKEDSKKLRNFWATNWEDLVIDGRFVERVKEHLFAAIDAEAESTRLNTLDAAAMRAAIQDTTYVPAATLQNWVNTKLCDMNAFTNLPVELRRLITRLIEPGRNSDACTVALTLDEPITNFCETGHGDIDNAFFEEEIPRLKRLRMFTICPGRLLRTAEQSHSSTELFEMTFRTIAHELSHSIDYKRFPQAYYEHAVCVQENYAKGFAPSLRVGSSVIPEQELIFRTDGHLAEVTADFWAMRAFRHYLKNMPAESDRRQATSRAWIESCEKEEKDYQDEGIHPVFATRFAISIGGSNEDRELLGCTPLSRPRACGLSGVR